MKKKLKIVIGYLYAKEMNIYGDTGNITCLKQRASWRGIDVEVREINIGDKLKSKEVDLYFFGGGQDQAQIEVSDDLVSKGQIIKKAIEEGIPLLSICGGYQLLGDYYKPHKGSKLKGVGLFPAYTLASFDRMIGNIVVESQFGKLVGFENHSGKTYLKNKGISLGTVVSGFGNNGEDKIEGCIYKNAIGCYMHGSLLPKNPHLADWLLKKALDVKYKEDFSLRILDDSVENLAHQAAIERFS